MKINVKREQQSSRVQLGIVGTCQKLWRVQQVKGQSRRSRWVCDLFNNFYGGSYQSFHQSHCIILPKSLLYGVYECVSVVLERQRKTDIESVSFPLYGFFFSLFSSLTYTSDDRNLQRVAFTFIRIYNKKEKGQVLLFTTVQKQAWRITSPFLQVSSFFLNPTTKAPSLSLYF